MKKNCTVPVDHCWQLDKLLSKVLSEFSLMATAQRHHLTQTERSLVILADSPCPFRT